MSIVQMLLILPERKYFANSRVRIHHCGERKPKMVGVAIIYGGRTDTIIPQRGSVQNMCMINAWIMRVKD